MVWSISERAALCLVCIVGGALLSMNAAAADAATDARARRAARSKLVEGVTLLRQGDYAAALSRFEEAQALVPSPKIEYDLGLAYLGLGRSADALESFDRFLAEAPDAPADKRAKARHHTEALRGHLARVNVAADASGVDVIVDGQSRGTTPLARPLYLEPGHHELAFVRPGSGGTDLRQIEASPGQQIEVALRAPALEPAPPPTLVRAPPVNLAPPPPPRDRRRAWAIGTSAAGVALLAAGLTFGLLAKHESDSLGAESRDHSHPPFDPSQESRGNTYQTLEYVGLAAGAAAIAAGSYLFVSSRHHTAETAVRPVVAPSFAGGAVEVSF
jgi:tetratricopeptide (TPR) repeat protein